MSEKKEDRRKNNKPKVRVSKLETQHIKEKVVKDLASGESLATVGKEQGVAPSTVHRFAKREEIKQMIEAEHHRLLALVPDAVEMKRRAITLSNQVAKVISGEGDEKDQAVFEQLQTTTTTRRGDDTEIEKTEIGNAIKVMQMGQEEGTNILKAGGIIPSAATTQINNFFGNNNVRILSPVVSQILQKISMQNRESIDVNHKVIEESDNEVIVDS